jgi:hypothetical protein
MYKFKVKDVSDLDLDRIIQENEREGVHATLLAGNNVDLLLISNDFLSQFEIGDAVTVCGQSLAPQWGSRSLRVGHRGRELVFSNTRDDIFHVSAGRAKTVGRHYAKAVASEIGTAIDYRRSIHVKVHQFVQKGTFA